MDRIGHFKRLIKMTDIEIVFISSHFIYYGNIHQIYVYTVINQGHDSQQQCVKNTLTMHITAADIHIWYAGYQFPVLYIIFLSSFPKYFDPLAMLRHTAVLQDKKKNSRTWLHFCLNTMQSHSVKHCEHCC